MLLSRNTELTNGELSTDVPATINESGTDDVIYELVRETKVSHTASRENASKQVVTLFAHNPKIRFNQLRNTIEHLVKEFAIITSKQIPARELQDNPVNVIESSYSSNSNETISICRTRSHDRNICSTEQFLQDLKMYSKTNKDQYLKIVPTGYWPENVLSEVYVFSKRQHKDFCSHLSSYLLSCRSEIIFFDILEELTEIDDEVKFYEEKVTVETSTVRIPAETM
ncbi:uncharacterized protein LOC135846267 [Planococcus citri]|uniref:uncharacterized protein LOC135846267 n=1 Tax=Planococcus citri TaxID=170843 RepID=UPI0031F97631